MPDTRKHRGAAPGDERLFSPQNIPLIKEAVKDLCWLLSRGYGEKSSLKLVGDRYNLAARQRLAVIRCSCSQEEKTIREKKKVNREELTCEDIYIDGYNLLTTIETALSGGFLFKGVDGTIKDLASVHGTYRKVNETIPAIELIGRYLEEHCRPKSCVWLLDKPVSNSGRLKGIISSVAAENNWNWQVELVNSPDFILSNTDKIIVSSDSQILNKAKRWFNLQAEIIERYIPSAKIIDLGL